MISKSSVCCRMIATHVKKIKKLLVWLVMLVGGVSGLLTSCVDNDDVPENYYSSTKLTALNTKTLRKICTPRCPTQIL